MALLKDDARTDQVQEHFTLRKLQERVWRLEAENKELKVNNSILHTQYTSQTETQADILRTLHSNLEDNYATIDEQKRRIEELEQLIDDQKQQAKDDLDAAMALKDNDIAKLKTQKEELQSQLDEVREFQRNKENMEQELASLKQHLADMKEEFQRKMSDFDRKKAMDMRTLSKDFEKKVEIEAAKLRARTKDQLDSTTKRTIMENEQMFTELHFQSKETEKLMERNQSLLEENAQLRRNLNIHKDLENELARRTHLYQRLLKKMDQKLKSEAAQKESKDLSSGKSMVNWLVMVADYLPKDVARNYEGIAQEYLGTFAAHMISLVFIFGGLSLGMSRMLFTSRSLAPLLASLFDDDGIVRPHELRTWELRMLWGCGLLVVLPLGMLRDISKLRFASGLAICTLTFAAAFIVFCNSSALVKEPKLGSGFEVILNFDSSFFLSLAMTTSNFSCHIAAIPIYGSLGAQKSSRIMRKVVLAAMITAAVVYQLVGLTSYARFGHLDSAGGSNVLEVVTEHINRKRQPLQFALVSVAGAGVAVSLVFGMPVVLWALRSVLLSYYRAAAAVRAKWAGCSAREAEAIQNADPSPGEWTSVTMVIVFAILILATAVPDIQVVMSFGGSLGGTFIAFMYPALFHLKVVKGHDSLRGALKRQNAAELGVIAMSVVYGAVCLSISFQKILRTLGESHSEAVQSDSNSSTLMLWK